MPEIKAIKPLIQEELPVDPSGTTHLSKRYISHEDVLTFSRDLEL